MPSISNGSCENTCKPAIDQAINAIHDEVGRYQSGLHGLISRLESPKPAEKCEATPECQPATIEEALRDIYNRLLNANEMLYTTNKRIDEQIGELKLLK